MSSSTEQVIEKDPLRKGTGKMSAPSLIRLRRSTVVASPELTRGEIGSFWWGSDMTVNRIG